MATISDPYHAARILAFEDNNYAAAIRLMSDQVLLSPNDSDLRLFLSRLYFWNRQNEHASKEVYTLLKKYPRNYDAYLLLIDIYESQELFHKGKQWINQALQLFPNDLTLQFRKAYNLQQGGEFLQALDVCKKILAQDKHHTKTIKLKRQLAKKAAKNTLSASYRYYFLTDQTQSLSFYNLQYGRKYKGATIIGMVNSARSFTSSGVQFNVEMYNVLAPKFYTYFHFGYSKSELFPTRRVSAGLYKSLNKGIETSLYINVLNYDSEMVRILAPSVSKTYKNSLISGTLNLINKGYDTEATYRVQLRQHIKSNPNHFVGVSYGSTSRDETIGFDENNPLTARFLSYEAQISFAKDVLFRINYNRNLNDRALARDQLTAYIKHQF